jgi:hypothetical protein
MWQSGMNGQSIFLVYDNVSVSGMPIPDCHISNVFFLCMSMSESLDCPFLMVKIQRHWHWHTKEKDVRDMTIRNGQSRDTDIDIHKNNVSVSRLPIPDCTISNVFFLCMSMSVSLDYWHTKEKDVRDMTIRNGQSRDTDIDMHNKKTLEMGQFLCMSMSVSLDF